jgi:hypothetical protein
MFLLAHISLFRVNMERPGYKAGIFLEIFQRGGGGEDRLKGAF